MSKYYNKFSKRKINFIRLTGINTKLFDTIVKKLEPMWKNNIIDQYKRDGRPYKLSLPDMLLMLLIYYRSYITYEFLGIIFGIDASRVCRIVKKLEPMLAKISAIKKDRTLSAEHIKHLLLDVTEQRIERPIKRQKDYYSGKKKCHTLKYEIRVSDDGIIKNVSKSFIGKTHDFNIHKQSDSLPSKVKILADSGYQGLAKIHNNGKTPIKKKRKRPLKESEKLYNKILSKNRVKVENVIAEIKVFKILSERYRNKRKGHNIKVNIISGLINMKNLQKMSA